MAMVAEELGQPPDNRSGTRMMNIIGQLHPSARYSKNHQTDSRALELVPGGLQSVPEPRSFGSRMRECDYCIVGMRVDCLDGSSTHFGAR